MDVRTRSVMLARVMAGVVGMQLSLPVAALGIGEPRHLSRLFEPLRVDIPIDAEISDADLRVRLMMNTDGDTAAALPGQSSNQSPGQSPGLSQQLISDASGQRFLRVTTRYAIREPMMVLHIDLSGHGLQVRRDLTLLFDPPLQDSSSAVLVAREDAVAPVRSSEVRSGLAAAAGSVAAVSPSIAKAAILRPASAPLVAAAPHVSRPASALAAKVDSEVPVVSPVPVGWRLSLPAKPGETLEQIAARVRPSSETPVATMAKLLRWNNPRAFDMHSGALRTGVQLRFPGRSQIEVQLAAFSGSPEFLASSPIAAVAPVIPPANVPTVVSDTIAKPSGLRLSGSLSADSMRLVVALASGVVPSAAASALAPTAASVSPITSPVTSPAIPAVALASISPFGSSARAQASGGADLAGGSAVPVATIFPAWLIAAALLLSGGMAWVLTRILRNTPQPIRPSARAVFASSPVAAPALINEWTRHVEPAMPPVRLMPKAQVKPVEIVEMDFADFDEMAFSTPAAPVISPAQPVATPKSEWKPEQFDLSSADEESLGDKRLPRSHPEESEPAMRDRRSGIARN